MFLYSWIRQLYQGQLDNGIISQEKYGNNLYCIVLGRYCQLEAELPPFGNIVIFPIRAW